MFVFVLGVIIGLTKSTKGVVIGFWQVYKDEGSTPRFHQLRLGTTHTHIST